MIVLDASAVLEALLHTSAAEAVRARLFRSGRSLHVPHLIDVEIAHALRRYARIGLIDSERGRTALGDLTDLPLRRYPHAFLLPRVWDLRHNMTAYDALYVALAEVLSATLLTRDGRLAASAARYADVERV